jgi:hypothetical protein
LQAVKALAGFLPDRDHLQGDHIHLARIARGEVIGQAQIVAARLAREVEAQQFFRLGPLSDSGT